MKKTISRITQSTLALVLAAVMMFISVDLRAAFAIETTEAISVDHASDTAGSNENENTGKAADKQVPITKVAASLGEEEDIVVELEDNEAEEAVEEEIVVEDEPCENDAYTGTLLAGSGSEGDPYRIYTTGDLEKFRDMVGDPGYADKYYAIQNDITFGSDKVFDCITSFAGYLDGQGYTKLTLDNDTFENTGKSRFFERRTSRVLY